MEFLLLKFADVTIHTQTGKVDPKDMCAYHKADVVMFVDDTNGHETYVLKNKHGQCGKVVPVAGRYKSW